MTLRAPTAQGFVVKRALGLRAAVLVAFACCTVASAAGIAVRGTPSRQLTGDEPHYLLTAISLAEDRSLEVTDEYRELRHTAFHVRRIDRHEKLLADGRLVSPHDPLLPALLAAPTALGGWVGAKLALALVAGLLGALLVWTAVRRLSAPAGRALAVVAVFGASAPLAVYGTQVYPELPAALALTVGVAALLGPLRRGGLAAVAAALIALPWLSVKYVPVAGVLAALVAVKLVRERRLRECGVLAGTLALAGAAYLGAHQAWYESWTVYAGSHDTVGSDPNYVGRARRLSGLLIDRTFGLVPWQPAWLLLAPALGVVAARRPRGWPALVLLLAVGWLMATFVALTMHGWWSPGRHLVVVLPVGVLLVAWWAGQSRRALQLVVGLGSIGVASYAWFVVEGTVREVTWARDFYETANPWYRAVRHALPDWPHETAATWIVALVWTVGLVAAAVYAYTVTRRACGRTVTRAPSGTTSVDGRWETNVVPSPSRTR
jgi:hypothetical protein